MDKSVGKRVPLIKRTTDIKMYNHITHITINANN